MATVNKKSKDNTSVIVKQLDIRPMNRRSVDIVAWRNALRAAEGKTKNRQALYELYTDILLDGHLKSIIGKRIKAITNQELKYVDSDNNEVEDLSKLTEKPWFEKILKEIVNSKFWGYSLIELAWMPYKVEGESKSYLIDRRHVKPEFGLVVKRSIETSGINYNEPPFINFVLRAGEDNDFGLILEACQYAIYKRGGFGDWSEFAEVFGMPFRTAKYSNPEDRTVLDDALANAGSAGYAVIPFETDIQQEYPSVNAGSSMFNDLRKACNEEMSVTILGQTETTNSSSSSGYAQSKTHADVEDLIHEDDRQFTLRVLNEELNRVLAALGYPMVKGGRWIFPSSDNIELKDRIDIDTKVANIVPVADDYFYKKYNIPKPDDYEKLKKEMLKRREQASQQAQQFVSLEQTDDSNFIQKLKDFFFTQKINTDEHYNHDSDCACGVCSGSSDIILADKQISKEFEGFIKGIYSGKITRNQLHQGMYDETAKSLLSSLGNFNMKFDYKSPDNRMLAHLRSNLFAFSGAKNLEEYTKIRDLMFDGKKLRPYNQFRDDVLNQVNEKYNGAYLQAEYQTAKAQSRSSSNWLKYERDADIYPYLEYRTAGDSRVRKEHARLNGFTAKISDPIWNKIYPPNGYRCRCSVRQVKGASSDSPKLTNEIIRSEIPQKYFQTNAGKTKMIFDENKHPYFVNTKFQKLDLRAVDNYGLDNTIAKMAKAKRTFKSDINTIENYKKWYDSLKNENGDIVFKDINSSLVAYTQNSYSHLLSRKQVSERRFEMAPYIKEILKNPDEIWSSHHKGTQTGKTKLTQRYIKFFTDKTVVINVIENSDKIEVKTMYAVDNINDDSYRSGVLIYKK